MVFTAGRSYSQLQATKINELYQNAVSKIDNTEYKSAIDILLNLDTLTSSVLRQNFPTEVLISNTDTLSRFKLNIRRSIAKCYLKMANKQMLAIPYLEYCLNTGSPEIFPEIYSQLAVAYYSNFQFDKSLMYLQKYETAATKNETTEDWIKNFKTQNQNAKNISKDTLTYEIQNIGLPVNTLNSELNPLISANNNVLCYIQDKIVEKNKSRTLYRHIMMTKKMFGIWSIPRPVHFNAKYVDNKSSVSLVGISAKGETIYVRIQNDKNDDIYACGIVGYVCETMTKLHLGIDLKTISGKISFDDKDNILFFAADLPGGFGGLDIYKVEKKANGNWTKPQLLGSEINTDRDEDAPFWHPASNTLYFSSQGHNSMGGFDIFKSTFKNNKFEKAINLGFPINTLKDNIYFSLTENGDYGYFCESQYDDFDNNDIYSINFMKPFPFALVKGTVVSGSPAKLLSSKIKVYDPETNPSKLIYNTASPEGKFYMLFRTGKDYQIFVEPKGYQTHLINFHVPFQNCFYEFYQEIIVDTLSALNSSASERITVRNIYYTSGQQRDSIASFMKSGNFKNNDSLIVRISNYMNSVDTNADANQKRLQALSDDDFALLMQFIEEAIKSNDTVSLALLDRQTRFEEKYSQSYYLPTNSEELKYCKTVIGRDTILSLPPINAYPNINQVSNSSNLLTLMKSKMLGNQMSTLGDRIVNPQVTTKPESSEPQREFILTYQIYFPVNKSNVDTKYTIDLKQIGEMLLNNPSLNIEIIDNEVNKYTEKLFEQRIDEIVTELCGGAKMSKNFILKRIVRTSNKVDDNSKLSNYRPADKPTDNAKSRIDIKIFNLVQVSEQ